MQCIICLEEEGELIGCDECDEIGGNRISLLRCISPNNCTFYAHQKCILEWHNTINQYECPICHFILPNEVVSHNDNSNVARNIPPLAVRSPVHSPVHSPTHNVAHSAIHNAMHNVAHVSVPVSAPRNPRIFRTRTMNIEDDDPNRVLNRIARFNLRRAERSVHIDGRRNSNTLTRAERHLNEIEQLRYEKNWLTGICISIISLCFLAGILTYINY